MSNKLLTAAVRSVLFTSAVAATAYPAYLAAATEETELEEVVVTGSLIPQDLNAPGVPVSIVSSADIAASGVNGDMLDVLSKTQPAFYGGLNIGTENGNVSSNSTNGGSQLSLRNRATLVLVNGRRVAISPVAASGGYNFVDLNMVPTSAIERVEVLTDGASATYGADAVGGVVNLILKSDYEGIEVGGRYGFDKGGDYKERSAYATMGTGSENTNITFSTEFFKSDPLLQKDRSWSRPIFRTPSFAGAVNIGNSYYYLNPALNAPPPGDHSPAELTADCDSVGAIPGVCETYLGSMTSDEIVNFFDLSEKPTMLLAKERKSAVLSVDHNVNEYFNVFGDFMVSNTTTTSQLNAQPVNSVVLADNELNPFNTVCVTGLEATCVTARNRLVDFPRIYNTDSTGWHGSLGFRGDIVGTWKYEVAGDWNYTTANYRNDGLIDAPSYLAAIDAGDFNPFARTQAPGVVESFQGTAFAKYTSSLYAYDFKAYGEIFSLPAGAVQLAVGADTREESLSYYNDRNEREGLWLAGTPQQPFKSKYQSQGYYAEVRVPVFSPDFNVPGFYALDLSLAGRQEVYDSTDDDPFVPKFTMRWQPLGDTFAVRASYSESFTAPTLYELYGPFSQGFTSGTRLDVYDSSGNPTGVRTGSRQYRSQSGSNTALDPATSKNWTAGVVWTPDGVMQGFEASIDYYNMDEKDIVGTTPTSVMLQDVEALGAASAYADFFRIGVSQDGSLLFNCNVGTNCAAITAPGQITSGPPDSVWLVSQNRNLGGVKQEGIDFRTAYSYDTAAMGTFSGQLAGTWLLKYDQTDDPAQPTIDLVGKYHDDYGLFPEYRMYLNLGWQFGAVDVGINSTYIPTLEDAGADNAKIDSYNTWDLRVGYDFADSGIMTGLKVAAGVNNITDEEPVYIESESNQSRDIADYDPIGTFYYVELSYKF